MEWYCDKAKVIKFRRNIDSVVRAFKAGVFSYSYAFNKIRLYYAREFGCCSGIYQEAVFYGGIDEMLA